VTYTGGDTVSTTSPLIVLLSNSANILKTTSSQSLTITSMTASGSGVYSNYSFSNITTGTYYLFALYDTNAGAIPGPGQYYDCVGGSNGGCGLVSSQPIPVTGATAGPAISFGHACQMSVTGSLTVPVTYTGAGTVNSSKAIYVLAYNTPNFEGATIVSWLALASANGSVSFSLPGVGEGYLEAVYDASATWTPAKGAPPLGDSYFVYGGGSNGCNLVSTQTVEVMGNSTAPALVFGDTCKVGNGYSLAGSVNYTGSVGTVSASTPMYVILYNGPNAATAAGQGLVTITGPSGTYAFNNLSNGDYYILAVFDPTGAFKPGTNQPSNGSRYMGYGSDSGCNFQSLYPILVDGNVVGPSLAVGDTCQVNDQINGSVTTTLGPVSSSNPLYVFAFTNSSSVTTSIAAYSSALTVNDSNFYTLQFSTGGVYYLGALYDNVGGASFSGTTLMAPSGDYYVYYDGTANGNCSPTSALPVTVLGIPVYGAGVTVGPAGCAFP
jgi:hypothetical protein